MITGFCGLAIVLSAKVLWTLLHEVMKYTNTLSLYEEVGELYRRSCPGFRKWYMRQKSKMSEEDGRERMLKK